MTFGLYRPRGRTELWTDPELRVLWLTRRNQELALSLDGMWLRRRRRTAELVWEEIAQVQAVPSRALAKGVRIEVFLRNSHVHAVGPFPRLLATRWIAACAEAAREHGERPLRLDGAEGFALP